MSDASSFSIVELTGPKNALVLTGRALPYRPSGFGSKMRAQFAWYPGSPIASVQMLGTEENETSVTGMWKDKFLKRTTDTGVPIIAGQDGAATFNGLAIADVMGIVRIMDGFLSRGQLLEMKWDEIIRQGILMGFDHRWLYRTDVEWEARFQWISKGQPLTPVAFGINFPAVDIANQLLAAIDNLRAKIQAVKDTFAAITAVINAVDDAFNAIQETTAQIADLANQVTAAVVAPFDAARSMVSMLNTVKDQARDIEEAFASVPGRALRTSNKITDVDQEQALEAEGLSHEAKAAARDLRGLASRRQQEVAQQTVNQGPIATFIAREGQDLRALSTQFYGTPHEWRRLAAINGITGSKTTAGAVVVIPRLAQSGV